MRPLSSLLPLVAVALAGVARAGSSCVAFDTNWNLLAFGFNGKDYNAGTKGTWASGSAQDITTTGRPPFNGPNATCFLSEYTNAIYVLGADTANPSSIYIYDAAAKSWTTQTVQTGGGFNPASFKAILDHDTNVFYALSGQTIYSLDMGLLKAANSSALSWNTVQNPNFGSDYQPVMSIAQNHVFFLDVPGVPAGSAKIFVIHYSWLQPQPQSFGNVPATHGQATSFFQNTGVQQAFAFIPDDGSTTYILNVESNTTTTLPGPSIKDSLATYFASTDSLVQLSSSGKVSYIPYDNSTSTAGTWNTVSSLPIATSNSANGTSTSATSSSTAKGSKPTTTTGGAPSTANGAVGFSSMMDKVGMAALFGLAVVLLL